MTLHHIGTDPRPWPLHGPAGSRRIEHAAQALLPPHTLMQRAGESLARLVLAIAPHARQRRVYCGPGNNGGDGLELAMRLHLAGHAVRVQLLGDPARLPADAAASCERARNAGVRIEPGLPALPHPTHSDEIRIDALLGLGGRRPADGALAQAIRHLQSGTVVAADLPSGLDAATGCRFGAEAVRASHTLSLLTLKPGLYTAQGRDACGDIWFDDLGVEPAPGTADAWLSGGAAVVARRLAAHDSHKGSFGDVRVVGGAPGMTGAALLASRAALAAGAGRAFVVGLDPAGGSIDPVQPELMHRRFADVTSDEWQRGVAVAGCGGGEAIASALPVLLGKTMRLVLDADALNRIAEDPGLLAALRARPSAGQSTVITPHPLEAGRLLGLSASQVQADRLDAARALAERCQSVVVLKGSGSVIAAPGRVPWINPTGNAALATAGTGDVLAGWLGGRWSGHAETDTDLVFDVAAAAVYRHGEAADGAIAPLRASHLVERLHALG